MGNIMRKSTVLLLMLGISTAPLFSAEAATSEISALQKQIERNANPSQMRFKCGSSMIRLQFRCVSKFECDLDVIQMQFG